MATIFLYHQKVKFVYSANLLLGKRVLLSALFLFCFIGLSGATSAFVGTPPAGNVAETQNSAPPKNSGDEQNWSAVFESPRPLVQDWRQYAARDELKPELQTPGRIVLERTPLSHYPIQILLLTLQANNIQVREAWQVSNAIHAFDINNDGELYLMADDEVATLVATVYLIDNFQMLNTAYQNLTASAVITVEVMSGDLSVEQPKRLDVVAGMAEEVYVFDVHGGTRPHTYTLLHNPDANAFAFSNGTLSVNVSATIGEYRFTVAVADAGNMSVTVVATVSVAMAATIRVAGGGAVFIVQGQEQEVGDGEAISFNPRSQSGVMVSVKAAATVALTAPDDSWQITLYGGGEAFFAGVAEAGSDDVVVGVSLMGDSDFVRNTDEKVALVYVFSDEVIVPVEPQGTRIFCRSYGRQWYLVIDEGVAEVLDQGAIADVNFLAFGDDVRWNLNGTLFKEEKPFTFDDFMATVSYRYVGEVGEVRANDGVAPSFSLVGDTDVFTVAMWNGYGQWLPGLLAIIEGQAGPLTLSVTVSAEDHLGDMLGDYGYANRMATVTAMVQIKSAAPSVLEGTSRIFVIGGQDDNNYLSDVWSLAEFWSLETAAAGWSGREEYQALSHNGRIYVMGGGVDVYGENPIAKNDVWSSTDGKTWTQETADADWPPRSLHQALSHKGRIYVLGGVTYNDEELNDVWSSADGQTWSLETDGADWSVRSGHQALSHKGRIYVMSGGVNIYGENPIGKSDVWSSTDGKTWVQETADVDWSPRVFYQALSHKGRIYVLGGTTYNDEDLNDVWSSADGQTWRLETADADWSVREGHQAVSYNGRIYVLGGLLYYEVGDNEEIYNDYNDVWSSVDGRTWRLETDDANWSRRHGHQAVVFPPEAEVAAPPLVLSASEARTGIVGYKNVLLAFTADGGALPYTYSIVASNDSGYFDIVDSGELSVLEGAVAGIYTLSIVLRDSEHQSATAAVTVTLQDIQEGASRIFVLGGTDGNSGLNDVWFSVDGQNWVLETDDAGWTVRAIHQALSHKGRIYVLGGLDNDEETLNDVWSSADGQTWRLETADADWSVRGAHQALSYNGRIYVLGGATGEDGEYKNDVWSSADGQSWSLETDNADWSARSDLRALSHNGRIYVLGGETYNDDENDVWSSANGKNWSLETDNADWSPRALHQALSHKGRIYVLGGLDNDEEILNDVWSSADGQTWRLETADADWPVREDHQALSYNGRIYVLGGDYYDEDIYNDVWSSVDGRTWRLETNSANWSKRANHQAVVFPPEAEVAAPPLVLSASEARTGIVGYKDVLLSFTANGGALPYTYSIIASNDSGYFDIVDSGELSALDDAVAGIYTLSIVLRDSEHQSATAAVTVTLQDIQEGASRIFVLGGADDVYGTGLNDVWSATDNEAWSLETATAGWSRREEHQALSHNGRLYVLGGGVSVYYENPILKNDVWSSTDGKTWMQETADADWSARSSHQALSHNGRLYVLGGARGENERGNVGEYKNDVWSSADGKNWSRETIAADWSARSGHQALSHKGRIYVLGGFNGVAGKLNDVWSSADGKNWSLETGNANWPIRNLHQSLSHKGRIYVLGGISNNDEMLKDVWSSADGQTWMLETDDADWSVRDSHEALSYNGRIYVLGGVDFYEDDNNYDLYNDVWSSVDGQTWTLETNSANWSKRAAFQAVVFPPEAVADAGNMSVTVAATVEIKGSRIFVLGGPNENYTYLRNVWSSADSEVWSLETTAADWSGREEHQALSHNGRIYVLGGGVGVWDRNAIVKNDVWSSVDGKTWMLETDDADWSPRALHQALSHNGRIYVLGGSRGEYGEYKNDVWSSADGQNWSLETDDADWSVRSGHQALSHNGRIYVLGGLYVYGGDGPDSGSNTKNDVWSSEDGKTWMLETGNANWPARDLHQALSYKGRIYVLGGVSGGDSDNEESLNDVWSSADGQTWTLETDDADWPVRENYQALSYNGRIYVLGGFYYDEAGDNDDLRNDVWSSVDGRTWRLETNSANWSKRYDLQAVVFTPEVE